MTDTTAYTNLITSEHADKANFMAMIATSCQPQADLTALLSAASLLYDIDTAVGTQLDVVGQWVGVSRTLTTPITGVYFSFDTVGLGFDEGIWQGPFDPLSGLTSLPDDEYRLVLYAKILNNHWDGDLEDAYDLAQLIFQSFGYTIFIQDRADLTMQIGLVGPGTPTALVQALLVQGKFNVKPIGVRVSAYYWQSGPGPIFAFDFNNAMFAGFDTGSWAYHGS